MGLFSRKKTMNVSLGSGRFVPNKNVVPSGLTSKLQGKAIKVWGTIYHQDVIARLQGTVPVVVRPTKAGDRFGWYEYQVMLQDGTIVGALNQWAVERAQIRHWQALAYVEHGEPGEQDRHRLFIPYADTNP